MSFLVGHLNVRSLSTGFDVLNEDVVRSNYDIVAISETWLNSNVSSDNFNIIGYNLLRLDRASRGGGIAFYIKDNLHFNKISESSTPDLEQLWIRIKIHSINYAFGVVYRPPKGNILEAVDLLDNSLSVIVPGNDEVLLAGDLNVNMFEVDKNATILINNMLESYDLSLINNQPTRISNTKSTLIDLIIYSKPEKVSEIGTSDLNISDHLLVYCKLDVQRSKHEPNIVTYRDFNNLNYEALNADLHMFNWHRIYLMKDIESKILLLNKNLTELFDNHIPLKTMKTRKTYTPWIDSETKELMKTRDYYYTLYKQTNIYNYFDLYKSFRNKVTTLIRNKKKSFLSNLNTCSNNKKLWKSLKKLNFKNLSNKNVLPEHLNNPQNINNYFIDSVQNLISNNNSDDLCEFYSSNLDDRVTEEFNFHLVTSSDVEKCFTGLKSNAVGSDGMSLKMLNLVFQFISKYITHIINFSLMNNIFPNAWKLSHVLPLSKIKNPKEYKDLRPVSILPTLSKLFEKIIFYQISDYINKYNILPSMQSGFRAGYSTSTGLLNVTDDIFHALDNNKISLLVTLDFSKAFDTINHKILCTKLLFFGFSSDAVKLVENYLSDRCQRVIIGSQMSTCEKLFSGVPQGSVLGPLLFNIYTADFHKQLETCSYHLYADDTLIYNSFHKNLLVENINNINKDLDAIVNFSKKHQLIINPQKSSMILFCKKKDRPFIAGNCQLNIMGTAITPSDCIKILGIYLDYELRFKKHVSVILQKAFGCLKLLYSNKSILDSSLRKKLVESLALSQFNYGDCIYGPCLDQITKNRVQKFQNSCLRFVLGIRGRDHISNAFSEIKWLKMEDRRNLHFACCVHKILLTKLPPYLHSRFKSSATTHHFNVRNKYMLIYPNHRSNLLERSFSYHSANLYNSIPNHFKEFCLHRFKREYRNLLLSD